MYKVEAQVDTKQLLEVVEQMPESELILKINQSIPDSLQERFNELIAKRYLLTLTDAEQAELIQLTDRIEDLDVKRIEYLAQLAQLRQRSLIEVMQDLNIQPPTCV